MKGYYELA